MKKKKKTVFRKSLLLPAEHGTWSWLLIPYGVGVGVSGMVNVAVVLILVGSLSAFLMRQPLTMWLRIKRGRGRRADGPLALGWTIGFGLAAIFCLAALLAWEYTALLWLMLPLMFLFIIYVAIAWQQHAATRTLWLELLGGAGLALTAPATAIIATNQIGGDDWALWGLMAGQNVLGALYVRLRLADTHGRPLPRLPVLFSHVALFVAVVWLGIQGVTPLLTAMPFAGFLIRAGWATAQPRPVSIVRYLGFSEVGVEILSGAWIVASYWLS